MMNIDFSERYDQETDIYYVTFKTGEPSFVKELDDVLLLEIGIFTHMPTGFRVLNYSKRNVAGIQFHIVEAKKALKETERSIPSRIEERSREFQTALESALSC